nr:TMV resistance protein N-like [Ipomoea batatas]GME21741.1 TMV resistance protein N-like [Ipomoea batatas]
MGIVIGLQWVPPKCYFRCYFQTTTLKASLPSPSSKFRVFLNFRGKDTRHNFVHHLHETLCLEGVNAFKDDININKGDRIRQELFHVIEKCGIAIPILSKDYATSAWCLDELVHIMKCNKKNNLIVFPVFFDVYPSYVRYLRGSFAEAFAKHEIKHKDYPKKVRTWKQALSDVAEISGFDLLNDVYKGDQSKCIHDITKEVQRKLEAMRKEELKTIASIEYHLTRLNSLLGMESPVAVSDGVLFLGIWGMNSNTTTTLMMRISNMFPDHFENVCLIQVKSLRKRGMVSLQKQLLEKVSLNRNLNVMNVVQGMSMIKQRLCLKKVLVILEGVDSLHQLRALVGSRDWFGSGSRIIITTFDKSVLIEHGMDIMYELTIA